MAKKAKKQQRLISKKAKRQLKSALPWAVAALSTTGMLAAWIDRGMRVKVRELAADTVEKVRPHGWTKSNGMVNGIVPQESGAV